MRYNRRPGGIVLAFKILNQVNYVLTTVEVKTSRGAKIPTRTRVGPVPKLIPSPSASQVRQYATETAVLGIIYLYEIRYTRTALGASDFRRIWACIRVIRSDHDAPRDDSLRYIPTDTPVH